MDLNEKIKYVIDNTEILILPRKHLSASRSTTIKYFIISEPFYKEFEADSGEDETVVREGKITWQKPKLITPSYMLRLEGFNDETKKALKILAEQDRDLAMLLYSLKFVKSAEKMNIIQKPMSEVGQKISEDIEKEGDSFSGLIKGVDEFWDISLFKFIEELIVDSAYNSHLPGYFKNNIVDVNDQGKAVLSRDKAGMPVAAKLEIDKLFRLFEKGEIEASELKKELDRWGVFEKYEDKFLRYFKNH